jgi:CPA2 family monovalent cation:H+ antiporter-2
MCLARCDESWSAWSDSDRCLSTEGTRTVHDAHHFLRNLAMVLGVAAITTVLFQRLRQPVVFGYLLAGLIIGPYVPIPLVADKAMVQTLSELGVIFVMFSLGLEFSLRQLAAVAPTAGTVAILETSVMAWLGYTAARLFGWPLMDSLFAGAAIAISSTTIIVKVFKEHRLTGRFTEIVFGILIVEDLIVVLLLALFTGLSTGGDLSAGHLALTLGKLGGFLAAFLVVGMLTVPRLVRFVVRLERPETTLVTCIGLCAGAAYLALKFDYSVALGAFLAGSLVSESGEGERIEKLIEPVRDMFAAIFFVSVGMLIDPAEVANHWTAVAAFAAIVIVGKVGAVTISTFLIGSGTRTAVQTGMSLAQIGEFSFIIAAIGLAAGATSTFLYPVVVAVSAITTLTTPWLIRSADRAAAALDRNLPRSLQTFVALYGSWIESMGSRSETSAERATIRRMLRVLALDAVVILALSIGASLGVVPLGAAFAEWSNTWGSTGRTGLTRWQAQGAVMLGAVLLSLPFLFGIVRTAAALGRTLARRAFPDPLPGRLDLAAAPRRAMVVTIQLAALVVVGAPLLAILQPFVPTPIGIAALVLLLLGTGFVMWRTTADLQGHVRAAAEAIVDAIARQARPAAVGEPEGVPDAVVHARELLPGLGQPHPLEILPGFASVGRSLSRLDLRGLTGATVVAIARGGDVILVPDGHETIRSGDVVALAGTRPAIEAAMMLLKTGRAQESESR